MNMNHTRSCLLLATASICFAGGCQPTASSDTPPAANPSVSVARPLTAPVVEWDEYVGRLEAIEFIEVRARVSGYLESIHFAEGQLVKEGDLLLVIDPRPFEAELNSSLARLEEANAKLAESQALLKQAEAEKADAEAQLTLADKRLDRAILLGRSNAISEEDVDVRQSEQLQATAAIEAANAQVESAKAGIASSKASIQTAQADVRSAELNVTYTQVRSPIDGRISRRYVTQGNLIGGGSQSSTLLTTIVSINPIHCYFDADEQAFLKYLRLSREGTRESSRDVKNPVYMRLVDEQGFPHLGHMDFVDNRIDPNTGTMRGRAIFPNDDNTLTPGLFAEVRLPGSGRYEAVLIPDSAIGSDQSEKFVYVVGEDNTIERRRIELGPIAKGLRVIRSGLDGSETIVTRGLQRVFPGVAVTPSEEIVEASTDGDLPDAYEPVPPEAWLSKRPSAAPRGVAPNNHVDDASASGNFGGEPR